MIKVKRAYDPPAASDGARFLMDRLWPRGIATEDLPLKAWLKDVAPSQELRQWFGHDPAKWHEFLRRYFAELESKAEVLVPLQEAARRGDVTLVYTAKDEEHNNAVALRAYLNGHRVPRRRLQPRAV
jgi:uncharacterized protein YeaO (DUF488 family)